MTLSTTVLLGHAFVGILLVTTLLLARDVEDERRTLAKLRLDADVAVVAIDDLLRHGEADAETATRALTTPWQCQCRYRRRQS